MLTRIEIDGFKSIVSQPLDLGRLNCLIGANGVGKSNVLEAIGVLGAAANGKVDDEALLRRGVRPGLAAQLLQRLQAFAIYSPNTPSVARTSEVLRFTDRFMRKSRNTLTADDASEGALYVLCCAILCLSPRSPGTFAIDNLDQALNPRLVTRLAQRLMGRGAEVVLQLDADSMRPCVPSPC